MLATNRASKPAKLTSIADIRHQDEALFCTHNTQNSSLVFAASCPRAMNPEQVAPLDVHLLHSPLRSLSPPTDRDYTKLFYLNIILETKIQPKFRRASVLSSVGTPSIGVHQSSRRTLDRTVLTLLGVSSYSSCGSSFLNLFILLYAYFSTTKAMLATLALGPYP